MRFLVATPILNGSTWIRDCLAAVNTAFRSFEYTQVIVDGGSTDGTIELIERAGYPNVKVISAPGTSMYEALNIAMRSADGDIFYQINADDVVLPEAPSIVAAEFAARPDFDVILGNMILLDLESGTLRPKYCLHDQYAVSRLATNMFVYQPSSFVRLPAVRAVGGYGVKYRFASDSELWLKLAANGAKFATTDNFLSIDRVHSGVARTGSKYIQELADLRAHWGRNLRAKKLLKIRNSLERGLRTIKGMHCAEGASKSIRFNGGALRRDLSFVFSGPASITIDTNVVSGTYPIQGYAFPGT